MATAEATRLLTPQDLLSYPNQKAYELIDGQLVRRHVSVLSSWVGGRTSQLLANHVELHRLGWIFPADSGCRIFPDAPRTVRRPDVTFVRADRLNWEQVAAGWLDVVPDLIVEVVSPHDRAYMVDTKVEMFLGAGVPLIWVINPQVRTVRIIRLDGSTDLLREGRQLSGEQVIAGFSCAVADLFPPQPPATPPAVPA